MDGWIDGLDGQDRERDRRDFVYLNIIFYSGWQISVYLHRNKQRSALKINTRNRFLSIRRLRWLRVYQREVCSACSDYTKCVCQRDVMFTAHL